MPNFGEAEWQEKQREKRPQAEVIERAREWLSRGLRAEDPEVHCGEQLTEARILVDDLLRALVRALREHQEREEWNRLHDVGLLASPFACSFPWDDPHSTSLASPTIVCPPSRVVKIERSERSVGRDD